MADVIERKYAASPNEIFSAVEHAVGRLGFKVQVAARGQHLLTFKSGMSMKTWTGQRMEAKVVQRADGGSTLFLSCRGSGQAHDWGEKKEVTAKFFSAVENALSEFETTEPEKSPAHVTVLEEEEVSAAPTVLGPDAQKRFGSRAVEAVQEVERSEPAPPPLKPRGRDLRQKSAKAARATSRVVRAINWQTLFSFRFLFGNLIIAALIAILPSLLWAPLGAVVFFGAFAVLVVVGATNPELVLYCPHCKKRVKAGASACHHCGRVVV